jgi:hypothetical protein
VRALDLPAELLKGHVNVELIHIGIACTLELNHRVLLRAQC